MRMSDREGERQERNGEILQMDKRDQRRKAKEGRKAHPQNVLLRRYPIPSRSRISPESPLCSAQKLFI